MVNGHVTKVASLMEGELPLQFNGGRMVMLQRWPF